MRKSLIYLCGPITGCSYEEVQNYYTQAQLDLGGHSMEVISPLRGKDYLRNEVKLGKSYEDYHLSTMRGIVARDYFDVDRCDIVLANFLGAKSISIGSVSEIARAHAKGKLIVLAMEKEGNLHDHPFITEQVGFRVPTLQQATGIIRHVLSTGV
jgi:nucleoside 2-deoxyribosyltransferase